MDITTILRELSEYQEEFPHEAVSAAVQQREEITLPLLEALEDAARKPEDLLDKPNYMKHLFAMFLLAQFREKRAYRPIVIFFSRPGKVSLDVTGDVATESLHRILASVSCGDPALTKQLIESSEANEFARAAAVLSLVILVKLGELSRDQVIDYFKSLFESKLEKVPSFVWDSLVSCSTDLYPGELRALIEESYDLGLVDEFYSSRASLQRAIRDGKESTLARLQANPDYNLVESTVKEMKWWACFKQENHLPLPVTGKIGRNEPCPCGSGKKYKKCCGAA